MIKWFERFHDFIVAVLFGISSLNFKVGTLIRFCFVFSRSRVWALYWESADVIKDGERRGESVCCALISFTSICHNSTRTLQNEVRERCAWANSTQRWMRNLKLQYASINGNQRVVLQWVNIRLRTQSEQRAEHSTFDRLEDLAEKIEAEALPLALLLQALMPIKKVSRFWIL